MYVWMYGAYIVQYCTYICMCSTYSAYTGAVTRQSQGSKIWFTPALFTHQGHKYPPRVPEATVFKNMVLDLHVVDLKLTTSPQKHDELSPFVRTAVVGTVPP